jgi:hypothetical protein
MRRIAACAAPDVPVGAQRAQVVHELPSIRDGGVGGLGDALHDGCGVRRAIRRQRVEVVIDGNQESRGDGNSHVSHQARMTEHCVHQCTAGASVPVRERVDGLELRVRER